MTRDSTAVSQEETPFRIEHRDELHRLVALDIALKGKADSASFDGGRAKRRQQSSVL